MVGEGRPHIHSYTLPVVCIGRCQLWWLFVKRYTNTCSGLYFDTNIFITILCFEVIYNGLHIVPAVCYVSLYPITSCITQLSGWNTNSLNVSVWNLVSLFSSMYVSCVSLTLDVYFLSHGIQNIISLVEEKFSSSPLLNTHSPPSVLCIHSPPKPV